MLAPSIKRSKRPPLSDNIYQDYYLYITMKKITIDCSQKEK